jgi:prepilin-type N-terminal cleavage/methylation domain-containing protein
VTVKRAHANRRGYTAVEVLTAMTLFAIGAAGVISMQRVTVQGGADARRFDVASSITHEWLARLQRDSMSWTEPNTAFPNNNNILTRTKWLKQYASCSGWCKPPIPNSPDHVAASPAFDIFGRDLPADAPTEHEFCVQYRMSWITDPPAPPAPLKPGTLMRAEVRVYWSKLDYKRIDNCNSPPWDPSAPDATTHYHFVYAATAIRQNPSQ